MAALNEKLTQGIKVPSALNKSECLQELRNFEIAVSPELTIQELRAMVKRNRVELGIMIDRRSQDHSLMDMIEKSNLTNLKNLAKMNAVGHPAGMELGELRLHLRQWLVRNGTGTTEVSFGKHRGKTFDDVWNLDNQYVTWSVSETSMKRDACWKLVQMAVWGVLTGKVGDPFDERMHRDHVKDKTLPPLCLAAILEIDDSIYQAIPEKEKKVLNLKSASPGATGTEKPGEPTKEELMQQINTLRQELRALKEERDQTVSAPSRKVPKD